MESHVTESTPGIYRERSPAPVVESEAQRVQTNLLLDKANFGSRCLLNQATKLWDSHAVFRRNWRRADFTVGSR